MDAPVPFAPEGEQSACRLLFAPIGRADAAEKRSADEPSHTTKQCGNRGHMECCDEFVGRLRNCRSPFGSCLHRFVRMGNRYTE